MVKWYDGGNWVHHGITQEEHITQTWDLKCGSLKEVIAHLKFEGWVGIIIERRRQGSKEMYFRWRKKHIWNKYSVFPELKGGQCGCKARIWDKRNQTSDGNQEAYIVQDLPKPVKEFELYLKNNSEPLTEF